MDKMSSDECKSYLEKFIADNFEAFVINGNRHFPFNLLKQLEKKIRQLIFVMHFNSDVEFFDANLITADYNECGYLAAKHLIERGKNRIALLTFEEIDELKRRRNGCSRNDYDFDILNGIEKAYKEASLDFYQHTALFHDPTEKDKSSLISQIKNFTEPGNTGVICVGDNRALSVYQAAQEIGIQIGKDLGVIGLYNTSWTRALFPALSSISINEEEIAKLTLQAITEGWKGKRIVIQPELIIRKST
jgi:LacI family transcriptional regulator